jgi:hypothetical protein
MTDDLAKQKKAAEQAATDISKLVTGNAAFFNTSDPVVSVVARDLEYYLKDMADQAAAIQKTIDPDKNTPANPKAVNSFHIYAQTVKDFIQESTNQLGSSPELTRIMGGANKAIKLVDESGLHSILSPAYTPKTAAEAKDYADSAIRYESLKRIRRVPMNFVDTSMLMEKTGQLVYATGAVPPGAVTAFSQEIKKVQKAAKDNMAGNDDKANRATNDFAIALGKIELKVLAANSGVSAPQKDQSKPVEPVKNTPTQPQPAAATGDFKDAKEALAFIAAVTNIEKIEAVKVNGETNNSKFIRAIDALDNATIKPDLEKDLGKIRKTALELKDGGKEITADSLKPINDSVKHIEFTLGIVVSPEGKNVYNDTDRKIATTILDYLKEIKGASEQAATKKQGMTAEHEVFASLVPDRLSTLAQFADSSTSLALPKNFSVKTAVRS